MILNKLIELRSSLASPSEALYEALTGGGGRTVSGERVNPEKALGISAYFGAIRAISEDVGGLPLPVYLRLTRGKKKLIEHPVYPLLNKSANRDMSAIVWRALMLHHALGWGNGYSEIETNRGGEPIGLWPLDPRKVTPKWSDNHELFYVVQQSTGGQVVILPERMFHLHGLGFDGITGYSIAEYAKQTLGLAIAEEKAGAALFGNSSRPAGVLRHPNKVDEKEGKKFKKEWEESFGQGSENFHKTAVLPLGMEWQSIAQPNKDAQWIEARQFSVVEIARWFRMPPHKLQDLTRGTYSNIDAQNIEYVVDTLTSWMIYFEQEVNRKLLVRTQDAQIFAEHLTAGLLRGDIATRFEAHAVARQWGWASANDVRELENQNPLPGDQGDMYLVPMNMVPADQVGKANAELEPVIDENGRVFHLSRRPTDTQCDIQGDDGPDEASIRLAVMQQMHSVLARLSVERDGKDTGWIVDTITASYQPVFADVCQRLNRLENDKISRAQRTDRVADLDEFYKQHRLHVGNMLTPYVRTFGETVWLAVYGTELPSRVLDMLTDEIAGIAERSISQSRAEVASLGAVRMEGRYEADLKRLSVAMKEACDATSQESSNGQ